MNNETDPMLGTADEQRAYREKIIAMMQEEMERTREERKRLAAAEREQSAVIIGAQGFGDGPLAIP